MQDMSTLNIFRLDSVNLLISSDAFFGYLL
jgi:hypothetical protein